MPVSYILSQAGQKMGLNPALASNRQTLLRYLNEAARELYDQSDMVGILMEQVFKVNGDQTISCPYYVGPIRAARELYSHFEWHIHKMRPRYNQISWKDDWHNLRLRNTQALMSTVVNQSVGVLTVPKVESPPVQVILVGPTDWSAQAQETVTMTETRMLTQHKFNDYISVSKPAINDYDITLSDVDGQVLTIIPNCMLEASYQIIDVSAFPWLSQNTSPQCNYLEILYKKALLYLSNDSDSFPSRTNYDDILVNKIMQLSKEEQDKPELAMAYDTKATRSLARKTEDQNRATEDEIALVRHPHDRVHGRVSGSRIWRYSTWGAGWNNR